MLRKLRERIQSEEKGFTLIELLVVILIIGILAAIALPAFLNQQKKGQDGEAKSNARNMVSQVESCFADTQDYAQCTTPANTGLSLGNGAGQVSVAVPGTGGGLYTVTAVSKNDTNTFSITKAASGESSRACSDAGDGGCKTGNTW